MANTNDHEEVQILKRELIGLFEHIQRIRKEIASIRKPGAPEDQDHFAQMADELDAIVEATEQATDTIMENVEQMESLIETVRPHVTDPEARAALDQFPDKTGAIFEACAFQDITGQRITKVVKSLQFIEQRVNTLINMWGPEKIAEVDPVSEEVKDEYQKYLHGPQRAGQGVSQADVDALFGDGPAAGPETAKPATPSDKPSKPAASKPAAPKADTPAAKPAPKKETKTEDAEEDAGPKLGQDDIDKLFG